MSVIEIISDFLFLYWILIQNSVIYTKSYIKSYEKKSKHTYYLQRPLVAEKEG